MKMLFRETTMISATGRGVQNQFLRWNESAAGYALAPSGDKNPCGVLPECEGL